MTKPLLFRYDLEPTSATTFGMVMRPQGEYIRFVDITAAEQWMQPKALPNECCLRLESGHTIIEVTKKTNGKNNKKYVVKAIVNGLVVTTREHVRGLRLAHVVALRMAMAQNMIARNEVEYSTLDILK